jgi:hypothetical protein
MPADVWVVVIPGGKLNTDKRDWMDKCGFLLRCFAGEFGGVISLGAFWNGFKSIAEDGPFGCGKKRSSGFVVSCGELWLIFGSVGVVLGFVLAFTRFFGAGFCV